MANSKSSTGRAKPMVPKSGVTKLRSRYAKGGKLKKKTV